LLYCRLTRAIRTRVSWAWWLTGLALVPLQVGRSLFESPFLLPATSMAARILAGAHDAIAQSLVTSSGQDAFVIDSADLLALAFAKYMRWQKQPMTTPRSVQPLCESADPLEVERPSDNTLVLRSAKSLFTWA